MEYSIGFNILHAESQAEQIQLSGDLVATFKRYASAWGDNMSSVLENDISAFLFSKRGGTLIELKRFLLEDDFRNEILDTVDDPALHYYFDHDYPMLKKGITPLLTRIDTLLRPKVIRYMLAQKEGIHIGKAIEEKKIILFKLSQGLMGQENAELVGSLFLGTFLQSAMGRQSLPKEKRHPYYLYLDECHHFMTPTISLMLSGVRKYGLGLILAHQQLSQIDDPKLLGSILSNPYISICFRTGEADAGRLSSQFSSFEEHDLTNLTIGQAIVRVGEQKNDFSMTTSPLASLREGAEERKDFIIHNSQQGYGTSIAEVERLISEQLPKQASTKKKKAGKNITEGVSTREAQEQKTEKEVVSEPHKEALPQTDFEAKKKPTSRRKRKENKRNSIESSNTMSGH